MESKQWLNQNAVASEKAGAMQLKRNVNLGVDSMDKLTKLVLYRAITIALLAPSMIESIKYTDAKAPQWMPQLKGGKVNGKRKRNPNRWR